MDGAEEEGRKSIVEQGRLWRLDRPGGLSYKEKRPRSRDRSLSAAIVTEVRWS